MPRPDVLHLVPRRRIYTKRGRPVMWSPGALAALHLVARNVAKRLTAETGRQPSGVRVSIELERMAEDGRLNPLMFQALYWARCGGLLAAEPEVFCGPDRSWLRQITATAFRRLLSAQHLRTPAWRAAWLGICKAMLDEAQGNRPPEAALGSLGRVSRLGQLTGRGLLDP